MGNGESGEIYLGDLFSARGLDLKNIEILRVELGTVDLLQDEKNLRRNELFELGDPIPNPFNPKTKLSFRIPNRDLVKLSIFDIAGRHVRTLIDGEYFESGHHQIEWDGRNGQGVPAGAGIYFYKLEAGPNVATKRMTLLK